jgi:hypothetical protein
MICTPHQILSIKSRRIRWAQHVVRMERELLTGLRWANLRDKDQLEDQYRDGIYFFVY